MLKLCHQRNGNVTEEYYFDPDSQKVYHINMSVYYAKQGSSSKTWPLLFGGGILAVVLEGMAESLRLNLPIKILLVVLAGSALWIVNRKVRESFLKRDQYVQEHSAAGSVSVGELSGLFRKGKGPAAIFGGTALIGLVALLIGVYQLTHTQNIMGVFLLLLGGLVVVTATCYWEPGKRRQVRKLIKDGERGQ